jgi:hypothetical protein
MSSINNFDDNDINRGVELMLRSKRRKNLDQKNELKKFGFWKMFSLFRRDIHFKIEIYVNNKK